MTVARVHVLICSTNMVVKVGWYYFIQVMASCWLVSVLGLRYIGAVVNSEQWNLSVVDASI